jgi:hypothetical protein
MEKDEAFDPLNLLSLGAPAVVPQPDHFLHPLQQTRASYLEPRLRVRPD